MKTQWCWGQWFGWPAVPFTVLIRWQETGTRATYTCRFCSRKSGRRKPR